MKKPDKFRIGKTFISITNPKDAVECIEKAVSKGINTYVCVSNPRTVVYANKHEDYLKVMNYSYMNIPDGEPIIWAARLWGLNQVKRTMGPFLFRDMVTNPKSRIKHFLLGDTQVTLDKITLKCVSEYGSLITGTFSPLFCDVDEYDYQGYAKIINESGADIVWLALRAPKQDFFAIKLLPYLDKKVCIGVGAAFKFFLGEYKMANPIIRKFGLMGLFWGKKDQKYFPFILDYFSDNLPYMVLLTKILLKRIIGKKYNE